MSKRVPNYQLAVENLVNGNLMDAKRLAKRCRWKDLEIVGNEYYPGRGRVVADYLDGSAGWETFCRETQTPRD